MCTHSNILFVSVRQRGVHQRIEHCKNNFGIQDHTHNLPSYCRTRYHNTRLTRRHRFLPYRDMSERSQSDPNLAGSHSDTYTIHFVPNECLPDKNVRLVRLTYTTLRSCLLGRCAAASAGRGTIHCNDRDDHMASDQDRFWHPNIRCCSPFRSSPFHRCIFHSFFTSCSLALGGSRGRASARCRSRADRARSDTSSLEHTRLGRACAQCGSKVNFPGAKSKATNT